MSTRSSLALVLLGSALAAQVPYGHFVVSARNTAAVGTGAYLLDGTTGDVTPLLGLNATVPALNAISTIAVDPITGELVVQGGLASSLVPVFYRMTLTGRTVGTARRLSVIGFAGAVADLTFDASGQILFCGGGGATSGLFRLASTGGAATLLGQVPDAVEVVNTPQAAFVLTRRAGQPSGIWRYDHGAATFGQVVSNLPEATAFDVYAYPLLLVGTQTGQILLADSISGAVAPFGSVTGTIVAMRVSPQNGTTAILTSTGDVFNTGGALIAAIVPTVSDLDSSMLDQAVFFTFAAGCAGSNSLVPAIGANGAPVVPNPAFAITLANALPSAPSVHVLGSSRRSFAGVPLPIDLAPAGAPGCAILCNALLISFTVANASGQASVAVPIPNDLSLLGARLMSQWWEVDGPANPLGLSFSDGGEAVLR